MQFINGAAVMIRGDSDSISVACKNPDGTPRPLVVGDKVYFTVKVTTEYTEKLLQKVVETFQDGVANILIMPEDTKSLKPGKYVFDVQISFADGTVTTIVKPQMFILDGDVTHE